MDASVGDVVDVDARESERVRTNSNASALSSAETVSDVGSLDSNDDDQAKVCMRWQNLTVSVNTESRVQRLRRVTTGWMPCVKGSTDEEEMEMEDMERNDIEMGHSADAQEGSRKGASHKRRRTIVHSNSGNLRSGALTALMGSSGAGKTTFLNALAHQAHNSSSCHVSGDVLIFGEKMSKKAYKKYCGYVWQEDLLMPYLTVMETLMFYAHIRLPPSMTMSEKRKQVERTIAKLGLEHCRNTLIGNASVRGISGGEKRRVSIAVELIKDPQVLFLDEPTSGLDAKTSLTVMQTLHTLAHKHNHTILCTIHQPRSQIFDLFDRLILMTRGHVVYSGPAANTIEHFRQLGHSCPQYDNPADYFIDVLTVDTTSEERQKESEARVQYIIQVAQANARMRERSDTLTDSSATPSLSSTDRLMRHFRKEKSKTVMERQSNDDHGVSTEQAGFIRSTILLTLRAGLNMVRDRIFIASRIVQSLIMALAISVLWWQMDTDQSAIQDRLSVLFLALMAASFPESLAALSIFSRERAVFQRERAARMYRVGSYYLSSQIANLPLQVLVPTTLGCILYWTVGLQSDIVRFIIFMATIVITTTAVTSLSMVIGAALPLDTAAVFAPVINIFLYLLGGFYVNPDNLHVWLKWTKFTSIFYYANSILIKNEFDGRSFHCTDSQYQRTTVEFECPVGGTQSVTKETCPVTDGDQIVEERNADEVPIWLCLTILVGIIGVLRVLLYFVLRYARPRA